MHPFGDVHIGHENVDLKFFLNELEKVPKLPNHRIVIMGDMLDIGIKTAIGGSVYDNDMKINEAVKFLCSKLAPYKEQIDGILEGNHEWRLYKECGIDICELMADMLHVPYMKHSCVITYSFNKRAYNINAIHGKVGGGVENALRAVKAMANKVFADVYLMAHCHHCASTHRQYKYVDSRNSKLVECTQYFVLTGHSLNYDESYADQMNLEISTKGFPVIELYGNTVNKQMKIITS